MAQISFQLKSQDVLILLKIVSLRQEPWNQKSIAFSLKMSQSEISQSLTRLEYCNLMSKSEKIVLKSAFFDFLVYGVAYVFPQKPGALVKGVPTAHSGPPLDKEFTSEEQYVWPYAKGTLRGQSIQPLYATVPEVVDTTSLFYEMLCLVDVLRIGKSREKKIAIAELKRKMFDE
ncbi:MAG: hypothetical protein IPP69_01130 [Flavobacteriales bacterium]|nr:hypothetical protein [Flavobacteriales bacterium]